MKKNLTTVLHVIIGLNVGGAEKMMMRLIQTHHADANYSHLVVSLTDIGVIGDQLVDEGVDVTVLGMRSLFDVPSVLLKLIRVIRKRKPDIVQTWMYHGDLIGGIGARLAGVRNVIWGIRTTDVSGGVSHSTALIRKVCSCLSSWIPVRIVCAADASRRAHIAVGYDGSRMVVIPNGFDLSHFSAADDIRFAMRSELGIDPDTVVIGNIGRLNEDKDHSNFVHAAGLVLDGHANAKFLMVGRDVSAANIALASWIDATGHMDKFILLGERSDIRDCLSAMDVFCLSSRTEGFPNVVGEAMAMGVPCVVTDVGDAAMLVSDTGIVVRKEDPVALAGAIAEMVSMGSANRYRLGTQARSRIGAEFSINRARERFEDIYTKLLRKGVY